MSSDAREVHPAAAVWPMLDEPDLRRLADDIAANGLIYPITLDGEGRVLDGRNRLAACRIAGVKPTFETYDGDPVAYVLSANNERRHLSTGQRAMATALTLAADGKRGNGKWAYRAVPNVENSPRSAWIKAMTEAGAVLDHAPDLAPQVVTGAVALSNAYERAEGIRRRAERIADVGGELAALVESGVIDIAEAERRADEAARLAALDADLADRVRAGHLAIGEAETIAAERLRRLAVWADKIRAGLTTFTRMARNPVPDGLPLTDEETSLLRVILGALEETPQ